MAKQISYEVQARLIELRGRTHVSTEQVLATDEVLATAQCAWCNIKRAVRLSGGEFRDADAIARALLRQFQLAPCDCVPSKTAAHTSERVVLVVGDSIKRNSPRMNELAARALVERALREERPTADFTEEEPTKDQAKTFTMKAEWSERVIEPDVGPVSSVSYEEMFKLGVRDPELGARVLDQLRALTNDGKDVDISIRNDDQLANTTAIWVDLMCLKGCGARCFGGAAKSGARIARTDNIQDRIVTLVQGLHGCGCPHVRIPYPTSAAMREAVGLGDWKAGYLFEEAKGGLQPVFGAQTPTAAAVPQYSNISTDPSSPGFDRSYIPEVVALKQKLQTALDEAMRYKADHLRACETIAAMHFEAVGYVGGPIRGVITDVADVRRERDELRAQLDRVSKERRSTEATVLVDVQDID